MEENQYPWLPLVRARFSPLTLVGIDRRSHLQILDSEYEAMRQALLEASRMRNQSAGPCRLPPELLTQIFAEAQSGWEPRRKTFETGSGDDEYEVFYSGWMVIPHVCSLWRQVALNDPMLWSRPEYDVLDIHPGYVPIIVSRCRGNPMRLFLNPEVAEIDEDAVKDDASYLAWTSSCVLSQACDLTVAGAQDVVEEVIGNLPETMPHLRQLYVEISGPREPNPVLPQRAWGLAGVTKLELGNCSLPWDAPIYSSSMTSLTLFSYSEGPRHSYKDTQLLLSRLPALKELNFDNIVPSHDPGDDYGSTIMLPPLLRELSIDVTLPDLLVDGLDFMAGLRTSSPCSFYFTIVENRDLFADDSPISLDGVLRQLGFSEIPHATAQKLVFNPESIEVTCLNPPSLGHAITKSLCITRRFGVSLTARPHIWYQLIKVLDRTNMRDVKELTFSRNVIDTLASGDMWKRLLLAVNVDRIDVAVGPSPAGSVDLGILCGSLCYAYSSPSATSSPSRYPFPRLMLLALHVPKDHLNDAFHWANALIDLVNTRAALGVPLDEIVITSDSSWESTEWDRLGTVIKLVIPK
ncbi:unnamed protein product [Peniophora sp. CBMAI 1063]|nr:unnamed protein product [Peniophora sp. CBMAI 1063]